MRRGFKAEAEALAARARSELGLLPHDPLPARQLARHHRIRVATPSDLTQVRSEDLDQLLLNDPNSWSAFTVPGGAANTAIFYNPTHSERRQESDLMHEIAHVLAGHAPRFLHRPAGFPFRLRDYDAKQEEEARWLGACLQLPRPALVWAARSSLSVLEMAEHFTASEQQIRFRWNITGMARQFGRSA